MSIIDRAIEHASAIVVLTAAREELRHTDHADLPLPEAIRAMRASEMSALRAQQAAEERYREALAEVQRLRADTKRMCSALRRQHGVALEIMSVGNKAAQRAVAELVAALTDETLPEVETDHA